MTLKLLLIGFNTRCLAESSGKAGYSFVSLDCFGDLDHSLLGPVFSPRRRQPDLPACDVVNMESLVEWGKVLAKREHCDSIVYASGLENHPELLAKLVAESGCRLYGNDPSVLCEVRDPVALSNNLRQAGYRTPGTVRAGSEPSDSGTQWLIKPVKSGGGHGIVLKDQQNAVPEGSVLQEYISGQSCSFTFVSDGRNCAVLGITEQIVGARSCTGRMFGWGGNIFPLQSREQKAIRDAVADIASHLASSYGLKGLNGVDFILQGKNCWVIEVNPRYSASMELLEQAYRLPMIKLHVLACSGNWKEVKREVDRLPEVRCFWAKQVVYTRTRMLACPAALRGSSGDERTWARGMYAQGLRDLPYPGDVISSRSPVATAVASGASREDCLRKMASLSALMRSQLSPVR